MLFRHASPRRVGAASAGVGVAVRTHMGLNDGASCSMDTSKCMRRRFTLKHWGAVCRGGIGLGSFFVIAGCGLGHQSNLDLLQEVAAVLKAWSGPWVVGGDFNVTVEKLRRTGWLELAHEVDFAASGKTCHDRTIDVFVFSPTPSRAYM